MNETLTTIAQFAVIIIAVFLLVALGIVLWILKQARDIFKTVRRETDLISHDIDDMRERARSSGSPVMKFVLLFLGKKLFNKLRGK